LRRWFALLVLALLAALALAQSYPKQTGWVTDEANLLSPADEQALHFGSRGIRPPPDENSVCCKRAAIIDG
jgi:uncharacterized membrane protein YgcG